MLSDDARSAVGTLRTQVGRPSAPDQDPLEELSASMLIRTVGAIPRDQMSETAASEDTAQSYDSEEEGSQSDDTYFEPGAYSVAATASGSVAWFVKPFARQRDEDEFIIWYNSRLRTFWSLGLGVMGFIFGVAFRANHLPHLTLCLLMTCYGLIEYFDGPELLGWRWRYMVPQYSNLLALLVGGVIFNTAMLSAEEATQEMTEQIERLERMSIIAPFGYLFLGLALGMQPLHQRRHTLLFWGLLAAREVQVLMYTSAPLLSSQVWHTWLIWWQPGILGTFLAQPVEALARQLWAGRMKLMHEVNELQAQVATLETTRREQLIRRATAKHSMREGASSATARRGARASASPARGLPERGRHRGLPRISEAPGDMSVSRGQESPS